MKEEPQDLANKLRQLGKLTGSPYAEVAEEAADRIERLAEQVEHRDNSIRGLQAIVLDKEREIEFWKNQCLPVGGIENLDERRVTIAFNQRVALRNPTQMIDAVVDQCRFFMNEHFRSRR